MERKNDPLEALDITIEVVDGVREFYGAFSMRSPNDDGPYDPRPMWEIPREELKLTPPRRWEAMAIRLHEQTAEFPSALTERLEEMLQEIGS